MSFRLLLTIFLLLYLLTGNAQVISTARTDSFVAKADSGTRVEIQASVSRELWIQHLSTALQPAIERAAKKGMKKGVYIVQVKFLVEKDGSISLASALNDPGYGLAKAAENAIKSGPRWSPGMMNGRAVRSYHTQPVGFSIDDK